LLPAKNFSHGTPHTQSLNLAKPIIVWLFPLMCFHNAMAQKPVEKSHSILSHHFRSLEDSAIGHLHSTPFGINEGWSIYKDIIFPGTSIKGRLTHNTSFLPGDTLLNCSITGGDAYNNLFFTYTLAKKWAGEKWDFARADAFIYSMDFYIDTYVDCLVPDNSQLEGLEFIFQQAMPPTSFLWGLQWRKENVWCYWDDTKVNHRSKGWLPIPSLNACMLYKQWNHLTITGHRNDEGLYYDTFLLNNNSFSINSFVPRAYLPTTWAENYLQVGFQINGNKAVLKNHRNGLDPVNVFLDNVQLKVICQH